MALKDLLCGMELDVFAREYWDSKPVYFNGACRLFDSKFSIALAESKVTEGDARVPQVLLASYGKNLTKADYTRRRAIGNHHFDDLIDVAKVYSLWNQGATIILQSLQTNTPTLIPILRQLEAELGHPVQANAYLTPPKSQGFHIHYDTHDVFIVQLEGEKHWRIWKEPAPRQPLKDEHSPKDVAPSGDLALDQKLTPGSVVYVPRGYYHEALSADSTSLHLTIGVLVYRRIDAVGILFQRVLRELQAGDPIWRSSLPLGFGNREDDALTLMRDQVLQRISEHWGTDEAARRLKESRWPQNQHIFGAEERVSSIGLGTRLRIADHIDPAVTKTTEGIQLAYSGRLLVLPLTAVHAVETILALRSFVPAQLIEYGRDTQLRLSRHLVREGLLAIE